MRKIIIGHGNQYILFLHGSKTFYNSPWMRQVSNFLDLSEYKIILPEFPDIPREENQLVELTKFLGEFISKEGLSHNLIMIGKSLGAKVAVEYCQNFTFKELILLGYPFTSLRRSILPESVLKINKLKSKVHLIQGSKDVYGEKETVNNLDISKNIEIHWISGADHNFFKSNETQISTEISREIEEKFSAILP